MTIEQRHYRRFRWSVLSAGALMVLSALWVLVILWPMNRQILFPAHLSCGCSTVASPLTWWATGLTLLATATALTMLFLCTTQLVRGLWRSFSTTRQLRRSNTRTLWHPELQMHYVVVYSPIPFAYTLGVVAPTVYVSSTLIARLDPGEVHAVLAHERAHQLAHDPLVAIGIESVVAMVRWLPGASVWRQSLYSLRELSADAQATHEYQQTQALSSAFIKLSADIVDSGAAAFSPNEERIAKLLDQQWTRPRRWWSWASVSAAVMLMVVLGLVTRVASAEERSVTPAAMYICRQAMSMCTAENGTVTPPVQLCTGNQCITLDQRFTPVYDRQSHR